jgi:hypothetical protein
MAFNGPCSLRTRENDTFFRALSYLCTTVHSIHSPQTSSDLFYPHGMVEIIEQENRRQAGIVKNRCEKLQSTLHVGPRSFIKPLPFMHKL